MPKRSATELQESGIMLSNVLNEFGVKGHLDEINPGPVVTLYKLKPAPGTKSARVIGLSEDIARSMSAVSARIAVIPGYNAIFRQYAKQLVFRLVLQQHKVGRRRVNLLNEIELCQLSCKAITNFNQV